MTRINVGNIRHPDGSSDNINLDSSGRVGIGGSPTSAGSRNTLTVNGASGSDFYLKHNGTEVLSMQCSSSSAVALNYPSSGNFYINRAGTGVAEFDGSGNLRFNSGYGSVATAYGCRAWVNFNGTGTVAIRGDGNVSSITDRNTGRYTINLTNAMPDSNYAAVFFCGRGDDDDRAGSVNVTGTSTIDVSCSDQGATDNNYADAANVYCAVFR